MSIDVSTHQLAEATCSALGGKIAIDDVLSVWHGIGNVVKSQLAQKKGVKLSSFGTFTLSSKGEPVFIMSSDLSVQFKLKQRAPPLTENIPTVSLNLAQISSSTGIARETVEKIYSKFMTCMGRLIFEGRKLLITIHHVSEIGIGNGELVCTFIPEFIRMFQRNSQKAPVNQLDAVRSVANKTTQILSVTKRMQEQGEYRENTFQIGRDEGPERQGKARSSSNARGGEINPITGGRMSAERNTRPASAGRPGMNGNRQGDMRGRPQSAGTMSASSLMQSPRGFGNQRGGGSANGGGLRREQLERHNSANNSNNRAVAAGRASGGANQQASDPRAMAAKALDCGDIIAKVRAKIVERGGSNGIRSIGKLLHIMDDNGDKRLSKDELKYGLRDYGIDLNPTELEQVFFYFDRDRNGYIDSTEFLVGLRGDLTERRKKFVRMAFDILDTDGSGVITTEEILAKYDLNWHPEVRAGKKTLKEAARDFMAQWDKHDRDGNVTLEEFEDYYKEVSASIDDDTYFELMIRNAWRIAGGEGQAANTANRRVLVTNKDGSQSVQTVNHELGMNARDVDDVRARLARQGVDAGAIELFSGVDARDKATKAGGRPGAPAANNRQQQQQRQPAARSGTPVRGGGGGRPAPRDAWSGGGGGNDMLMQGPGGGDESMGPGDYGYDQPSSRGRQGTPQRRTSSGGGGRQGGGGFDAMEVLHKLLYNPPISLEALCARLQVSSVSNAPRVAMGAFAARMSTLDPSLDRDQIKALWKLVDPRNVGSVEVPAIHELLGGRYGKDKTQLKGTGIIERAIKKILERCGELAGLKGLQRSLSVMDDNGDKRLTKDELKYGLQDYGVELNLRELEELFNYFDRDRNGFVDVTEFFIGIKGDLNERRKKLVRLAFNSIDTDRSGVVSTEEMMEIYNFKAHPDVVSGKKTIKEAMKEFMAQWGDGDGDGDIEYSEFEDYYKGVSASIDGDDYFELMIRNAWRIAGGEGQCANTANRRVLVTNKDGSQSVQTVNHELGMNARDIDDVRARLARQGVDAGKIEMFSGMDTRDKAKSQMPARGNATQRPGNNSSTQRPSSGGARRPLNQTAPGRVGGLGSVAVQARGGEFERNMAAAKLAAAYRGRLGRKEASHERRKVEAEQQQRYEEQEEQNRPKPRQILRPKGNSYIGF